MNYQTIKLAFTATMAFVVIGSSTVFAKLDDRTTEKTRDAVESAGPDDWYTLAISAEKCFKKKVNMKEASKWLDQSIEIAETPFNLELKGDYYMDNRLPDKALEFYVRAMNNMKENDGEAEVSTIQKKIAKIIHIGG
jgi:hypothetical protein